MSGTVRRIGVPDETSVAQARRAGPYEADRSWDDPCVTETDEPLDVILARWVLGELPPEDVPPLAVKALLRGCESPTVAVLAGMTRPTRGDVEDEVRDLLLELKLSRPSQRAALKSVVDHVAQQIVSGTLAPPKGARRIWAYEMEWVPQSDPVLWPQFRPFVGLASACEDDPDHAVEYDAEIVREAQALLDRGGLATE
jgi:hypothetical protein